jgi:hypothetical protein
MVCVMWDIDIYLNFKVTEPGSPSCRGYFCAGVGLGSHMIKFAGCSNYGLSYAKDEAREHSRQKMWVIKWLGHLEVEDIRFTNVSHIQYQAIVSNVLKI